MKFVLATVASLVVGTNGLSTANGLSPVTRVVELLKSLGAKVESELKTEEDLFETFECWAKSVVSQKTKSNAAASARKQELETYVEDLDAGRIELTTERVDLEKEIAGLSADIEQAEALRAKEKADYEAAKKEMDQAIAALTKAIDVMDKGTKPASLLRLRASSSDTIQAREANAEAMSLVLEIARDSLSKADVIFLQRVLTGEVPVKDWKKLNRKATFKEKYGARSGDIQKILSSLLGVFEESLNVATAKETKVVGVHGALMTAKNGQKTQAQDALVSMEVEGGARGLSKTEATAEIEALGKQIEADTKYIGDAETALATKTGEWKDRKQIRTDEVAAINKAIATLASDDARDLFKKSLSSQGYLFVQVNSVVARNIALHKAFTAAGGRFDKVFVSIDKMVADLKDEEADDLKKKEGCEKTREEDTRKAIVLSRAMDELSDTIQRLKEEIEELQKQIEEKKESIAKIKEELKEAKRMRDDQNTEWKQSDSDDKEAVLIVGKAIDVLTAFYASVALVQQKAHQPVEGMKGGEAPPPPPSTWEASYKGAQDQQTGIVAIMGMVKSDIEKDQAKAKEEEDVSQKAYDTFKAESEQQITDFEKTISEMEGTIADKEGEVQDAEKDRLTKKGELETILKKIKDASPGCDFFTVNFETRLKIRQLELDGLKQAKQALSGAKFSE